MSSRCYNLSEIGFVADDELITYIKENNLDELICGDVLDGDNDIPANHSIDEINFNTFVDFMESQGFSYDGYLESCSISPVNERGIDWLGSTRVEDEIFCLQLSKFPQLFKAAYNSIDEIVDEIKDKIGHLLPENYDIAKHIFYVEGVCIE